MNDEIQALRNEIASLSSELASMRQAVAGLSTNDDRPATAEDTQHIGPNAGAVSRRGWMKAAAGAAVGGTAVAIGAAQPAAATDTDPIKIGQTNNVGASRTVATHTGTGAVSFLFRTESAFNGSFASYPAALGGWSGSTARPNGIYGYTNVADNAAAGVVGVSEKSEAVGVKADNPSIGGTALQANAPENGGTAVNANGGFAGVSAEGFQHGVVASGGYSALLLPPSNAVAPPDRTNGQPGGSIDVQLLSDSGAASLWFCSAPGAPGVWQKLAGPFTAGAFHAIEPKRVYDSRSPLPTPGKIAAGANRVVSLADGRNLATGAVERAGLVPDGATAVTYNLTVAGTEGSGFVAVSPGGAATFGASTINWGAANSTVANAGVVKLDPSRQVKVFAEGSATHVIIDITGYYR